MTLISHDLVEFRRFRGLAVESWLE